MALDKNRLKGNIVEIMNDMMEREVDSIDEFADRLAVALIDEIKEAQINYISGLTNSAGPVTGTFEGNLI